VSTDKEDWGAGAVDPVVGAGSTDEQQLVDDRTADLVGGATR
jgi:hypothetical protein